MVVAIVGGTQEGRELADELVARGVGVVSSLAGRTRHPAALAGEVRQGGFGGVAAMLEWLRETGATCLIDAAHPFAASMHRRCAEVAADALLPLLRVARPSWADRPDAFDWRWVGDHDDAVAAVVRHPALVTVGKQEARRYAHLPGVVLRMTEMPDEPLPHDAGVLLQRGPFTVAAELETLDRYGIGTLVTKDSGGAATEAKLDAAAQLGVDVVMIARPEVPGVPSVSDVASALDWVRGLPR